MFAPALRICANAEPTRYGLQFPLTDIDYFSLLDGDQIIDIVNAKCESKIYPTSTVHQCRVGIDVAVQSSQV